MIKAVLMDFTTGSSKSLSTSELFPLITHIANVSYPGISELYASPYVTSSLRHYAAMFHFWFPQLQI
jgi:hypothetical protein